MADDFTPLAPRESIQRTQSALGGRTKAQLVAQRRKQSASELQEAYGDLQKPKRGATASFANVARPKSCEKLETAQSVRTKPLAERLLE